VVTFDDSATGTTTVNLTTALSPASIFVTNVYLSYIFTGSGGISGAPLTISGPLTLDNAANRFSSVALISGGMLQLGNNDAKGSLATSGGILGAGTFTNDGTLIFDRSDNVVVTNIIAGSGGLSQIGPDQLTLTGANTYTNATSVTAGTLALGPGGSIGGSAVTVSSGATLANATTGAVAIGGTTTFNPGAWASFTALGSGIVGPINVTGDLALNGNGIIVNVTGSTLGLGSYRLMNCTGTLTGSAGPATITGIALASGYIATISTTAGIAGHVDLVVNRAPAFSGLIASPSITYGASNITLSGTVSFASGGTTIYAANGDMVSATINGQTVNGTVSGASGGFSITYNDPSLQTDGVNGSPYTITYFYAGNSSLFLNSAVNTSTSLKVQPLPVILAGSRLYDGTATAAASILSVVNAINSDVVKVASGSCTLAGTNVGVEAITSFGSLVLGGAAAANYTLAGASGSVTIIAAPPFSITSGHIDNTGHNIIITWQSVPGTVYQVIAQTNVSAPLSAWTNVGNPIAAINTNTSATNPITQVWDFFAVKNAGASSPVVSGAFSITSGYIDSTGSNIVITWQSTVNAVYHVIAQTNISAPLSAWTNVGNAITATNTSTSATNPVTQPLNFFRVRSP
jgi:autotransporter-associated beta strand protein